MAHPKLNFKNIPKTSMAKAQTICAMLLLPIATATFLGFEVGKTLYPLIGFIGATIVGICVGVGLECLNAASGIVAFIALAKKRWLEFFIALLGVIAYVVVGMLTIAQLEKESQFLMYFFLLSPVAFIPYALLNAMEEGNNSQKLSLAQTKANTANLKMQLKLREARPMVELERSVEKTERKPEFDERLAALNAKFSGGSFTRQNVQDEFGLAKTMAWNLIKYGQENKDIVEKGRGRYEFNHKELA